MAALVCDVVEVVDGDIAGIVVVVVDISGDILGSVVLNRELGSVVDGTEVVGI